MANAFTPCPVCSPARASFHTGRIPSAHGIHDHIGEQNVGAGHPGIAGQTSLADVLQGQGYQTGLVGKWHLNHFQQAPPGWETWFSNATGTNARFGAQPFYESGRSLREVEDDEGLCPSIARRPALSDQGSHLVERFGNQAHHLADRAVRFLRERDRGHPFYLFVGFTNTHTPHEGEPERWVQRYRECTFADLPHMPPSRAHGSLRFHYPTDRAERRDANAQYYAAVSVIDEMAGRVLHELADQQAERDTLVVYTSDHGHMNGHHGLHTKGNVTTPQNFLEESIRIPCLLSWPGRIRAASVHPQPVDHCDLFMTLADAAGCDRAELAQTLGRTGRSCLPLLSESPGEAAAARSRVARRPGLRIRQRAHDPHRSLQAHQALPRPQRPLPRRALRPRRRPRRGTQPPRRPRLRRRRGRTHRPPGGLLRPQRRPRPQRPAHRRPAHPQHH